MRCSTAYTPWCTWRPNGQPPRSRRRPDGSSGRARRATRAAPGLGRRWPRPAPWRRSSRPGRCQSAGSTTTRAPITRRRYRGVSDRARATWRDQRLEAQYGDPGTPLHHQHARTLPARHLRRLATQRTQGDIGRSLLREVLVVLGQSRQARLPAAASGPPDGCVVERSGSIAPDAQDAVSPMWERDVRDRCRLHHAQRTAGDVARFAPPPLR
jgi:hypothetical protein